MFEFPMNILTTSTGKNRKLLVKPVNGVKRQAITIVNGKYHVNPSMLKIPCGRYFVETKEQGHFHFYSKNSAGEYSFFSKRVTVNGNYRNLFENVKFRNKMLKKLPWLFKETAIAVELIWPDHQDSQVPTAIKECPEQLRVVPLSVAVYKGEILMGVKANYLRTRKILEHCFTPSSLVELHQSIVISKDKDRNALQLEQLLDQAKRKKLEGFVLKQYHYDRWYKLKGIQECDVFVIGFVVSTSESYEGMVTSVKIGVMDNESVTEIGRVSGFNYLEVYNLTQEYNQFKNESLNAYMGKVLRVTFQEITVHGNIKHGFFDGWRTDKVKDECTAEQLK